MTRMKKFLSLMIAVIVVLSVNMMLFADVPTSGTITITHAEAGVTYSAYKVFDAELTEVLGGTTAKYYIDSSSPWYSAVSATGSPFTLTQKSGSTTVYEVAVNDEAAVIDYLKENMPSSLTADYTATATTSSGSTKAEFTDVDFGYYFVNSASGSIAAITPAAPNATIVDKSQDPTWEPEDPNDTTELGKFVAKTEDGTYGKESTAALDDVAYFKIKAYCPKYSKQKEIISYKFTDTLDDGFSYIADSAKLYVNDTEVTTGFTATVDSTNPQIIYFEYQLPTGYEASSVEIRYSATVDKDAVYDNVNSVAMDWSYRPYQDPSNPNNTTTPTPTPSWTGPNNDDFDTPDDQNTDTYVYTIEMTKYAEKVGGDKIDGAKFELYESDKTTKINVVKTADGKYRVATSEDASTSYAAYIETDDGVVDIFGLDLGTYYIKETEAPEHYNILNEYTEVEISTSTADATTGVVSTSIVNNKGTLLPSTGGVGTKIFFAVGGSIMLVAVIALITKKRMEVKDSEEK